MKPKSNTENLKSSRGHDAPKSDSVFDFLYSDTRRIASFLSQFNSFGHLTEIVHGEEAKRSKTDTGKVTAKGKVPLLASVDGQQANSTGASYGENSHRVFDPSWINALTFLDQLTERNLINRDLTKAGIGEFVLHTGPLKIHDLHWLEKMWHLQSIKKVMRAQSGQVGNRASRKASQRIGNHQEATELDMVVEMLTVMPHSIQAQIGNHWKRIWCTLLPEALSTTTSDLTLKHGSEIPGEWTIVGILDARPRFGQDSTPAAQPDMTDGRELGTKLVDLLSPFTRTFLGRPDAAYGLTPLLIFREIGLPISE